MLFRVTALLFFVTACSENAPVIETVPGRWYTAAQVESGESLYQLHCAACHAADGSATTEWRTPDAAGNYPPPPLNGTAHTWHHPLEVLDYTIENGGGEFGGVMPGFAALLQRNQRLSIVAFIQSWWPDDIYVKWEEIDDRSR